MNVWGPTEYTIDIIQSLVKKENKRLPFYFRSPQQKERPHLVSWIQEVSEELKLRNTTLHLAVYVLDIFMDNHEIASPQLKLFAIVCLLLAAKFEELDSNIPKISALKCKVDSSYLATDFITMEIVILKFVGWDLAHPTAAHFLEYFSSFAVQSGDLKCCRERHVDNTNEEVIRCNRKRLKLDANELIQDFVDLSYQDIYHMKFRPSVIAGAIVYSTRKILSLKPEWPPSLARISCLKVSDIISCSTWLIRELGNETEINSSNTDQGYSTQSSSGSPDQVTAAVVDNRMDI